MLGVTTNVDFLRFLLADPDVVAGRLDTGLLDRRTPDYVGVAAARRRADRRRGLPLAARAGPRTPGDLWAVPSGWRIGAHAPTDASGCARVSAPTTCTSPAPRSAATAAVEDGETRSLSASSRRRRVLTVTLDGLRTEYVVAAADGVIWLAGGGRTRRRSTRCARRRCGPTTNTAATPNSSARCRVRWSPSASRTARRSTAGTVVVTVEAMKMEHALSAPVDGVVELLVAVGDQVKVGQPLARIIASTEESQA